MTARRRGARLWVQQYAANPLDKPARGAQMMRVAEFPEDDGFVAKERAWREQMGYL